MSYSLWGPKESDTSAMMMVHYIYIEREREREREGGGERERERNLVKESYKMIWEKCDMFIT